MVLATMTTSQKFHLQVAYSVRNPPTMGPRTGPQKLAAVKRANGTDRWDDGHKSVMVPPAFATAGRPNSPAKKRKIRKAAMLGDSAHPIFARQNIRKDE